MFFNTGVELAEALPETITIGAGSDAKMLTVPTCNGSRRHDHCVDHRGRRLHHRPGSLGLGNRDCIVNRRRLYHRTGHHKTPSASKHGDHHRGGLLGGPGHRRAIPGNGGTGTGRRILTLIASVTASGRMRTTGNFPTSVTIPASTGSVELTFTTTDDGAAQGAGTVTSHVARRSERSTRRTASDHAFQPRSRSPTMTAPRRRSDYPLRSVRVRS